MNSKELDFIYIREEKKFIKNISFVKRNVLSIDFFSNFFKNNHISRILYIEKKICIFFSKKENMISFNKLLKEKYNINSYIDIKDKKITVEEFKFEEGNKKLSYIIKVIYEDLNRRLKFYLHKYKKEINKIKDRNVVKIESNKLIYLYRKFFNNAKLLYNKKIKEINLL